MKILWIASWFPTPYSPFNGDFIERMGKAVSPYCEIVLLHVSEGPVKQIMVVEEEICYKRIIVTTPAQSINNYLLRFLYLWKGVRLGIKRFKKLHGIPTIVHLHVMFPLGIFCFIHPVIRRTPLIVTEHWSGYRIINWYRLGALARVNGYLVSKKAKIILPVNPLLAEDMKSIGIGKNFCCIPNVVDTNLFSPGKTLKSKLFVFLHISSLIDEVKNVTGIIDSFRELSFEYNDILLKIIGDGEEKENFEKLVKSYGLGHKITFLGEIDHTEVADEMTKADCLVHFSNYENLPCVILEALSSGLPVIATETGGISDWVTEKTGILIKPKDLTGLKRAMKKIIDQKQIYDSELIRSQVVNRCSQEFVGRKIFDIYKKILND